MWTHALAPQGVLQLKLTGAGSGALTCSSRHSDGTGIACSSCTRQLKGSTSSCASALCRAGTPTHHVSSAFAGIAPPMLATENISYLNALPSIFFASNNHICLSTTSSFVYLCIRIPRRGYGNSSAIAGLRLSASWKTG